MGKAKINCRSNVKILVGKYRGKLGYVVTLFEYEVSVRYQTGHGWQTSKYLKTNVEVIDGEK